MNGWRALLLLLVLLGAWELYVDLGGADPLILPAPHAVAQSLYTDRSLLWSNFLVTAEEVLLGIAVAAVAGLAFAIAIHLSQTLRRAVYPLLVASQTLPVPIIAPVLVLWLGFGILPKLLVIALVSFFSIVVTTSAGFAAVDPDLVKLMRTFDASRLQDIPPRRAPLRAARRVHRGQDRRHRGGDRRGVRRAGGRQLRPGLPVRAIDPQLLTARAYAAVVILSVFAIALFALLTLAERLALPWAYEPTGDTIVMKRNLALLVGAVRFRGLLAACGEKNDRLTSGATPSRSR